MELGKCSLRPSWFWGGQLGRVWCLGMVRRWSLVPGHQPCSLSAWAVVTANQPNSVLTAYATSDWTGLVGLCPHSKAPALPAQGS